MIFKGQTIYKQLIVGSSRIGRFDTETEHFLIVSGVV
jgi:hypothetical protein